MVDAVSGEPQIFLSTLPARRSDRRIALAVVSASVLIFAAAVPFARVQLPTAWSFVAGYQSVLVVNGLITAILLYAQFSILRSRAMLVLASGYLFATLMAVVQLAPSGLLGAHPHTAAWLYMLGHGGFPLLVIGYAVLKDKAADRMRGSVRGAIASGTIATVAAVGALALMVTAGPDWLPAGMNGDNYSPAMIGMVSSISTLSFAALLALWVRRRRCVLDVWLMVVMCAWLLDIALSAVLNAGQFDLGFYAGRIYGVLAASLVLLALLLETGRLYAHLDRLFEVERRRAAAEISAINAKLETLLESSPLPMFSLDSLGHVATWNRAAERVLGNSAAEVIGREFATLPENAQNEYDRSHRSVMAGKQLQNLQMRWLHRDGRTLDVVCSGAPVHNSNQHVSAAVYVAEDVTEKRKLERQLAQSRKMEAIGQLTGGIAHDFNNVLTVIIGMNEILADGVAHNPQLAAAAKTADEAAEQAADLIRNLLAFARQQPLQPRLTDINELVATTRKLLKPTLGEQIELVLDVQPDTGQALVDPPSYQCAHQPGGQCARCDAGRRQADVGNEHVVLDGPYAQMHADVRPGPYVMIAVSDTGGGIAAANIEQVFEPFFTTKEAGNGTGLGLSMVYGFVKQSNGHVKVYSEVGYGTTIKIYLPFAAAEAGELPALAPETSIAGGSESILVVEDDPRVREYVSTQLKNLGYHVLVVSNASEALALADSNAEFELLLTDVILPGALNGRQLAGAIARRRPSVKVLYTSGYTEKALLQNGRLELGVLLLPKPYRKSDLARMVRLALGGTPGAGAYEIALPRTLVDSFLLRLRRWTRPRRGRPPSARDAPRPRRDASRRHICGGGRTG